MIVKLIAIPSVFKLLIVKSHRRGGPGSKIAKHSQKLSLKMTFLAAMLWYEQLEQEGANHLSKEIQTWPSEGFFFFKFKNVKKARVDIWSALERARTAWED
jgi:hypothetical protein